MIDAHGAVGRRGLQAHSHESAADAGEGEAVLPEGDAGQSRDGE